MLPRPRLLIVALLLVAAAVAFLVWPRGEVPAEEQLRRKAVQLARAAEEKDLAFVMEQVSERFRGAEGLSKQELKGVLAGQLLRGSWVRIFLTDLSVTLTSGTSAEVSAKFIFGRSEAERLEDLAKESVLASYAVEAKAEKEADGEWRFVSARYRQAEPF